MSEKTEAFYKGCTNDLARRIGEDNAGYEKSTSSGRPWKLMWLAPKPTSSEARQLERKIKNITSRQRMQSFIKRHGVPDAPFGGLYSAPARKMAVGFYTLGNRVIPKSRVRFTFGG